MSEIKPAEVSAILREQLSGFKSEAELEEVGTVLQIGDGIARIYGLGGVQYGELIEFDNGLQGIALNLEEDNVGAVLFTHTYTALIQLSHSSRLSSNSLTHMRTSMIMLSLQCWISLTQTCSWLNVRT